MNELPLEVEREPAMPLVGAGRRRTGEHLDPAVVERIIELRRNGATVAAIRRELGGDARTILTVIRRAQEAGLLTSARDHLLPLTEDVARLAGEEMLRRISTDPGKVPANVLPIIFGVALDKRAALLAEDMPLASRADEVDPVERLREAYASLKASLPASGSGAAEPAGPALGVQPGGDGLGERG